MGSVKPTGRPGFSYLATSRRPGWSQLPVAVREAVGERLGGAGVIVRRVGGGFTSGLCAVVVGAKVIDGVMPAYPWTKQDLEASLEAVATTAEAFTSTNTQLRDALELPGWD